MSKVLDKLEPYFRKRSFWISILVGFLIIIFLTALIMPYVTNVLADVPLIALIFYPIIPLVFFIDISGLIGILMGILVYIALILFVISIKKINKTFLLISSFIIILYYLICFILFLPAVISPIH
jgi:hypothetical protein